MGMHFTITYHEKSYHTYFTLINNSPISIISRALDGVLGTGPSQFLCFRILLHIT